MKKEYVLLMMLLVGFLIPMTIASKNLDFVKIEIYDDEVITLNIIEALETRIDIRETYKEGVAIQDIR